MTTITDTDALADLVTRLKDADYVTVDTEFLRDNTYYSKLCLIQLADDEGAHAVDPLAEGIDLAPFYELMNDSDVLKVLHSCRQDMEIFFQATGRLPAPIFDTQVAAMVCGFGESVGYETLVNEIAKERLDKTARFTDWSKRPLSRRQLDYALGDVTHLRTIYEHLHERIERAGRAGWLEEEMAVLSDPKTYELDPAEAHKRIKTRSTSPRFLARLQHLATWREEQAQERDMPRNRIAKDDVLLEIAANPPDSPEGLADIRGLSKGFHNSDAGQALWTALEAAEAMPKADLPKPPKSLRAQKKTPPVADLLKLLLKLRCQEAGVAAKLVASGKDVEAIARGETEAIKALSGWRREVFGKDALALKAGTLAITAAGDDFEIVDIED